MRRNTLIVGVLLIGLLCAAVLFLRKPPQPDGASLRPRAAPMPDPPRIRSTDPARRQELREQRDALRRRILQALAASPTPVIPDTPSAAAPTAAAPVPRPPGNLVDRIGGREALARQLNHDFMPLADECIERAQETSPQLAGMLILGIETVADQELGAVVEQAEPSPRSSVSDPGLLECIRETALSLRLPPPPASGREKFELSLRIEPKPATDPLTRAGDSGNSDTKAPR